MTMELTAPPLVQGERKPGELLRNQLAAAVRSINWSYAIFWSVSSSYPRVLTWQEGFYNDEIRTRKIANSLDLTVDQLILHRSDQLRELYEFLLSGGCEYRKPRPIASLSPEDLGDIEWYYILCMTYAFHPGQGLPGRCFANNEHVWLCNAHLADNKTFFRAILAKKASIQTIVCIPLGGGVLELGTTASVPGDSSDLLSRATTSFNELKFATCTEDPSENKTRDTNYVIMLDDLNQHATGTAMAGGDGIGTADSLLMSNKFEQILKEFDDFYHGNREEPDLQTLQDSLVATSLANKDGVTLSKPGYRSGMTCFTAWTIFQSGERTLPVTGEAQKLLKKIVAGRAWTNKNDGKSTARLTQESCVKNHVISERRRREKLNEMFHVLKSLVPTIRKMDKASILEETIVYLKELERKVTELESRRELISSSPNEKSPGCHDSEVTGNRSVPARAKKNKVSNLSSDMEMERHWVCSEERPFTMG